MSFIRKTTWICDVCEVRMDMNSGHFNDATLPPQEWKYINLDLSTGQGIKLMSSRRVLMCCQCLEDLTNANVNAYIEEKKVYRRSFWRKLFGKKELEEQK